MSGRADTDDHDAFLGQLVEGFALMGAQRHAALVENVRNERKADKLRLRGMLDAEALLRRAENAEAERDALAEKVRRARDAVKD